MRSLAETGALHVVSRWRIATMTEHPRPGAGDAESRSPVCHLSDTFHKPTCRNDSGMLAAATCDEGEGQRAIGPRDATEPGSDT